MKKAKKLTLNRNTIRLLAAPELVEAAGGFEERTSGSPDACPPASVGAPSCTGCPSINYSCFPSCWAGNCTIITM